MKFIDIIKILETWAPKEAAWDRDNVGLQVGTTEGEISNIFLSLDLDDQAIDQAINKNCNFIITHHPLIFSPIKKINTQERIPSLISRLIKNNITLFSSHTNLDYAKDGVSFQLAKKLDLLNIDFLQDITVSLDDSNLNFGAGTVGELETELSQNNFLKYVSEKLSIKNFRYSNGKKGNIKKVAVCGGSGIEYVKAALSKGCDAFITADIKYHAFQDAEGKILLIDAGHYETEIFILNEIEQRLKEKLPANINVYKNSSSTNPIIFYNN